MSNKVRVSGRLVWVGQKEYKGRPYWRVGIVPDGEEKSIFLNSNLQDPPGKKGDHVTIEVTEEALEKARGRATEVKKVSDQQEDRIVKSVALKAAADAIAGLQHTDITTLSTNVKRLAADFESYLTGETPF